MSRLQLRLWASTPCNRVLESKCILLEHAVGAGESVVLAIDARGLAAVVTEAGGVAPTSAIAGTSEPWPTLQLHRTADGKARWMSWPYGAASPTALTAEAARTMAADPARAALTDAGRRAIVAAIHGYYVQHVLEPSVAGFLSVLEKQ